MVTIKDILKKYNIELNLHQKVLELDFSGNFELKEMKYEPSNQYGDDGPYRFIKEFTFKNENEDMISIRPELERTTIITVTDDLSYYNKYGDLICTLIT